MQLTGEAGDETYPGLGEGFYGRCLPSGTGCLTTTLYSTGYTTTLKIYTFNIKYNVFQQSANSWDETGKRYRRARSSHLQDAQKALHYTIHHNDTFSNSYVVYWSVYIGSSSTTVFNLKLKTTLVAPSSQK